MRLIILDLLGVVFPNKFGGSRNNIKELYGLLPNKPIDFDQFYQRYQQYMIGAITSDGFWQGFNREEASNCEKQFLNGYEIFSALPELIKKLKQNYLLISLSNHPAEWIDYLDQKYNLSSHFVGVYISGKIKMKKPETALFQKVSKDFNLKPEECVLVDDQNKNLLPASQFGFRTIRVGKHKDPLEFTPNAQIATLGELPVIIPSVF